MPKQPGTVFTYQIKYKGPGLSSTIAKSNFVQINTITGKERNIFRIEKPKPLIIVESSRN